MQQWLQMILAVLVLSLVGTGVFIWRDHLPGYQPIREPVTFQQLRHRSQLPSLKEQHLRTLHTLLTERNNRNDFSLLGSSTTKRYRQDIGRYQGRIVQEAFRCFREPCPNRGHFFLSYKEVDKERCVMIGGHPITAYSQRRGAQYGGCSPLKLASSTYPQQAR
jgi:hypothetical protein